MPLNLSHLPKSLHYSSVLSKFIMIIMLFMRVTHIYYFIHGFKHFKCSHIYESYSDKLFIQNLNWIIRKACIPLAIGLFKPLERVGVTYLERWVYILHVLYGRHLLIVGAHSLLSSYLLRFIYIYEAQHF